MKLTDLIGRRQARFTFKNHYGENKTMSARKIYHTVMQNSRESDYDWIAPASELVNLCKNPKFPREYAVNIETAILTCFANIESRVNRGGDKYATKAEDAAAVQYCYDELGRLEKSTDNKELKKTLNFVRTRYLKEMISSAVNTTIRGDYIYCDAYGKLKEEVIGKYFVEYSVQEGFNIKDMYEEISDETDKIFRQAYESGMFKQAEDEAMFSLVKMFNDDDIFYPKKHPSATFKGNHTKNDGQKPQSSNKEDILSK